MRFPRSKLLQFFGLLTEPDYFFHLRSQKQIDLPDDCQCQRLVATRFVDFFIAHAALYTKTGIG